MVFTETLEDPNRADANYADGLGRKVLVACISGAVIAGVLQLICKTKKEK